MIAFVQQWLFLILAVALLLAEIWAFVNAARFRPDAYVAASKRTKGFWMLLTGLAMLLGFLAIPRPFGLGIGGMLFMIGGIVVAGIFLADVLPALRSVMHRSRNNRY